MSIIAFILVLIAAILFAIRAAGGAHPRWELTNAGLFFLTVGLMVQFMTSSHPLHF